MKFQMNRFHWMGGCVVALAGVLLVGTTALGKDLSIKYPVKRFVTGRVMSITEPFEKGRDGEINVSEKVYRLSSKTVMVDRNEQQTALSSFNVGDWVYIVVNLYADHREILYMAPSEEPADKRLRPQWYSDSD